MAEKQQDLTERLNKIVKKERDEDRSLGPAAPRKPIGKTRGMAWVNSTGGVSTASAGGSSSGGSGGSGGPGTAGGSGGSDSGFPGDADNSVNYGAGGGGGGYRDPQDPTDPDSGYEPLPPAGTEAGTNDMTGDEAMAANPDKGDPTGFGTSMDGTKAGWHCSENEAVKIRLGLEGYHIPPDGWETGEDGMNHPPPTSTFYYWSSDHWSDRDYVQAFSATIEEQFPGVSAWYEEFHYPGSTVTSLAVVKEIFYAPNEWGIRVELNDGAIVHTNRGIFQVSCTSYPAQCTDGNYDNANMTYPEDDVCGLQLIDGMWVPDPQDPDCAGLSPQRCYLVSNSCPSTDGVMFCVRDDMSVMATNYVNGAPEIDGITRIYSRQPDDTYKQTGWVSNSQRDEYF